MRNSVRKTLGVFAGLGALALGSGTARAETAVPGGNVGGQVWTTDGSPYLVRGDLTVEEGATLRIEEGATVVFAVFGVAVGMTVLGTLNVTGTVAHPVTIDGDNGTWAGITVKNTASITGAIIRRANAGAKIDGAAATLSIARSRFETCGTAISTVSGEANVDAVDINGGTTGISAGGPGVTRVVNSLIRHTSVYAFNLNGGTVTVLNSTVHQNGTVIFGLAGTLAATNSIFSNNKQLTILRGTSAVTIGSSVLWANQTLTTGVPVDLTGDVTADPGYVSDDDLHIMAGSPCIDAGSATGAPDHDFDFAPRPRGPAVDIGAYELSAGGGAGGAGGLGAAVGGRSGGPGGAGGAGGAGGLGGAGGGRSGGAGGTSASGGAAGSSLGGVGTGGVIAPPDAGGSGGAGTPTDGGTEPDVAGTGGRSGGTGGAGQPTTDAAADGRSNQSGGGCGCRTAGGDDSGQGMALVALALAGLTSLRRRRRAGE